MFHSMNLIPSAFSKIADGSKTIELRLNDEKRQKIKNGDTVAFSCSSNKDIIMAQVMGLHKLSDFEELYRALPLERCGYTQAELSTAHYTDMEHYYTKEQIKKYGALGIELGDVLSVCDVKEKISDTVILELLAPSVYNPTPERLRSRAMKYQVSDAIKVYAYAEAGEYQGIIVFEIKETEAAILDIAVRPESRGRGVGSRLIDFMFRQFRVRKVIAETDDDAVGFYKKYGFSVTDAKQTL